MSSSFSLLAQTAMSVAWMNVVVCMRSGKSPYSFTLTGVSAGQVSAQRFWWIGHFCCQCSTVIGNVPQGYTAE